MTTRPNLDDLTRLADAATEGPWTVTSETTYDHGYGSETIWWADADGETLIEKADAEFIAAARTAMPSLVAALRAVLAINTGDNRRLYGNDFEAGMAKALWLVKGAVEQHVEVDRG